MLGYPYIPTLLRSFLKSHSSRPLPVSPPPCQPTQEGIEFQPPLSRCTVMHCQFPTVLPTKEMFTHLMCQRHMIVFLFFLFYRTRRTETDNSSFTIVIFGENKRLAVALWRADFWSSDFKTFGTRAGWMKNLVSKPNCSSLFIYCNYLIYRWYLEMADCGPVDNNSWILHCNNIHLKFEKPWSNVIYIACM